MDQPTDVREKVNKVRFKSYFGHFILAKEIFFLDQIKVPKAI
jgi:hypothetical protein